jgi:hypothetical protein
VKGQPIVCTPAEALETFLSAGLDALAMGDVLVTPTAELRTENRAIPRSFRPPAPQEIES